ncbi:16S rRNA (guanine(1207)-N(2))-methyltransferase RsmC [Motilimonas eburnea]|uniref:16S rRNA (guanine(1207)-N(2))-methyltransferase RsmC n=1 Tax=Motilimonas eburnea TaxID=1737488 RepID=UPI001E5FD4EE|nr:16S rRNA (guanine(1207)-N(2))-methyltransferase RsmC [Motilimonas eburnea]MCE2571347.1 16S rRNA (guanine(1207)-N(2))-methyltransferase RsmC [Motilimonas eburnea]
MTQISSSPTPASQVLERNLALFADKKVLVAGAIEDTYPIELANTCDSVTVFTTFYPTFNALKHSERIDCHFAASYQGKADEAAHFDAIILYVPKAKAEVEYLLANLMPHLKLNGLLYLVGENRGGIKSINKQLTPYANQTTKLDSARRCSLLALEKHQVCDEFQLDDWLSRYSIEVKGQHLEVISLPGVFSAKELDLGTQVLLENIAPLKGNALDIGCGAGVIGAYLLKSNPDLNLDMIDVNALAVESTKRTLAANGLTANVFASDVYSDVNQRYNTLVSNPPFHAGLNTHYGAAEQIINQARQHLKIRGRLIIVANKFLRYEPLFEQSFSHCESLFATSKFKLLSNYPD